MASRFAISELEERIAPSLLGLFGGGEDGSSSGSLLTNVSDVVGGIDVGGIDVGGIGNGNSFDVSDLVGDITTLLDS